MRRNAGANNCAGGLSWYAAQQGESDSTNASAWTHWLVRSEAWTA